ncbi:MAG: YcaO-like family protein [Deltaproteobacteria bacterium]|nr:YcaO-like family protein [Deltaproteobacteria bacterium]
MRARSLPSAAGLGNITEMAIRTSSSVRDVALEVTWARARALAPTLGITRITETTWLDRAGVPVAVAIRPDAAPGSLCVTAGKGMTVMEAMVGATMEAIEYAWAEHNRASLRVHRQPASAVLDGATRPHALLDLCPIWGQPIAFEAVLDCVEMHDIVTETPMLVPAELVFHPFKQNSGLSYFGTSTNGLCSGNTVEEATVHGLCEVVERDVLSFHRVRGRSLLVDPATLPPALAALAARLADTGFDLTLRALPNPFQLPCYLAFSSDREQRRMTLPGSGCHPSREIAATRAICETLQARLSLIHGGRDDLAGWAHHDGKSRDQVEREYHEFLAGFGAAPGAVAFDQTFVDGAALDTVGALRADILSRLTGQGFGRVLRTVYTPRDYPVQVVRVLVPGLEFYSRETRRRGPRLAAFIRSMPPPPQRG